MRPSSPLALAFAMVLALLFSCAFMQTAADKLYHKYCFCHNQDQWGWVQTMDYHSERMEKTYSHAFTCGPAPGQRDHNKGHCGQRHILTSDPDPLCYTFDDDIEVCMKDYTYAFDGHWMGRLPGWYRAGPYYQEGFSRNKHRTALLDCTSACRKHFPDIEEITGACNYTHFAEVVPPLLVKDQCRAYEYGALSVL